MKRVNDDFIYMTDEGTYLYEGEPFTGISYECAPDGQLVSEITYQNGKQEGLAREWYDTGELRAEMFYANNELHGWSKEWYKGGQPKSEAFYEFAIRITCKTWAESGELVEEFQLKENDPLFKLLESFRGSFGQQNSG